MKIKTVLVAGLAGGIGYVLGTKAGPSRYEEIKAKADQIVKSPQVQETVANLAEGVKKNAAKLPDPVADVVTSVADKATGGSSSSTGSSSGGSSSAAAGAGAAGAAAGTEPSFVSSDLPDSGLPDSGLTDSGFTGSGLTEPGLGDVDEVDLATLEELTAPDVSTGLDEATLSDAAPFGDPTTTTDPFDSPDSPPRSS